MLKIKRLFIKNVNNLKQIEFNFNDNFNIICGQNGTGKTTILNCILGSFRRKRIGDLYVNAQEDHGFWEIEYFTDKDFHNRVHYIDKEVGFNDVHNIKGDRLINTNYIISFNVNNRNMTSQFFGGNQLKSWLYKNYYKSDLNHSKEVNFSLVRQCFNMIDDSVSFYKVDEIINERNFSQDLYRNKNHRNIGIYVQTSKGIVLIDHMSSGYQSVLMILLSLIRKIESLERFGSDVHNFEGVILIDEIDLYLHPEWQKKLVEIIRWLIPRAQIITTTHSPHIIQSAMRGEIIPLGLDSKGNTYVRELPESNEFGYQGWTIEEILTEVMGLQETTSHKYTRAIEAFENSLELENIAAAREAFSILDELLHPSNHMRKLLKIQLAALGD